jgi:hypothetical protein
MFAQVALDQTRLKELNLLCKKLPDNSGSFFIAILD